MTLKDRKTLLAFLADEVGYTGAKTLADIQKFWDDESNGIEIVDQNGDRITGKDLKTFWERTPKVTIETEDDEGDEPKKKSSLAGKISKANAAIGDGGNDSRSPAAFKRIAARKAYDRKAATGRTSFADADTAEAFGAWFRLSTPIGKSSYAGKSFDEEICTKANVSYDNTSGGATIPEDFQPTLIDLKERYGVARQVLGTIPMMRDSVKWPRVTGGDDGGVVVYAPGEATAITESNPTFDNVNMVAVEMGAYTEVSSTLVHDSAISMGDHVAKLMARAFVKKEDNLFINGDGTSTYFNVQGVREKIKGLSGTIANIAGLVVGSGNAYSELTLSDHNSVVGLAPAYVDVMNPLWIVHKRYYYNVMRRLALAVGGVTGTEVVNGIPRQVFDGYPVIFSQVMPRVEGNSQVCALFGAFGEGAKLGEVTGGMSIDTSTHFKFSSNVISFRAIQRVAITVHDVGNADANEANRVAGPIVGLITAAS